MVEHYGKWADLAYPAMAYPAFACGVGSVLSKDLVRWMADNAHVLHTYQVCCACVSVCVCACVRACVHEFVFHHGCMCLPQMATDHPM